MLLHSLQRRELVELPVIERGSQRPSTVGNELEP
jgi:hypothetical protein